MYILLSNQTSWLNSKENGEFFIKFKLTIGPIVLRLGESISVSRLLKPNGFEFDFIFQNLYMQYHSSKYIPSVHLKNVCTENGTHYADSDRFIYLPTVSIAKY